MDAAIQIYERFPSEGALIDALIEARFGGPVPACVHCGSLNILRVDTKKARCRDCKRKFSVLKGTLFEGTKVDLRKWLYAIMKLGHNARKGISSCELARDIGVQQKTAWLMLTKIREAMAKENADADRLWGVVEIDECYMGGKPRKLNSKWVTEEAKPKTPVITMIQRPSKDFAGRVRTSVPEPDHKGRRTTAYHFTDAVMDHVDTLAEVHTDEHASYGLLRQKGFMHESVRHNKRYVSPDGHVHINSAESFHADLKRCHYGIYHKMSPERVVAYAGEAEYRWNRRREKPTFSGVMKLAERGRKSRRAARKKPEQWPPAMDAEEQMELWS